MNGPPKQQVVRSWINTHNFDVIGLLETRATSINLDSVKAKTLPFNWGAIYNLQDSSLCRILIGWNPQKVAVHLVHPSVQLNGISTCLVSLLIALQLVMLISPGEAVAERPLWKILEVRFGGSPAIRLVD
ncbi:hypothetical protein SADUNF_Sadunf05G0018700 [Salix dunnii]|uniref:Uncharacterized protein n=1 Tax=Salix dunnii TaxID=1413687 RepID=A0A835K200_9ROSI|nr:hypothetical protein SADUNF_Sadunf05G0018700 [Salix dunnii]